MVNCSAFLKIKKKLPASPSQGGSSRSGLTLIELIVVLAIIGLLALIGFAMFSPQVQLGKARDAKRKADLQKLSNVLGDYYNDFQCYPSTLNCGASLSLYLNTIPCDPQTKDSYGYEGDCSHYKIFAKLENTKDAKIAQIGCDKGCGPNGSNAYNFGVSSSNVNVGVATETTPSPSCTYYACQLGACNIIGPTPPSCPLGGPSFCNDVTCGGGCSGEGGSTPNCRN